MGRWTLVAVTVNGIVGSGIFGLPSKVHALIGSWALLAYVVCAAFIACIALCFAEVSSRFTGTGGPYLYAERAFGPTVGFLTGWVLWIARVSGIGAIASVMASYLALFWAPAAAGWGRGVTVAVAIVALTIVNLVGVRSAARTLNALTLGKLLPLLLFIGVGLFFLDPHRFAAGPVPVTGSFSKVVLALIFAFSGFEAVVIAGGEMREPRRDLPFALLIAVAISTVLYVAIQTVCIGTLPDLAASQKPLADASVRFMGSAGATVIALGALVSTVGTMAGSILLSPRLLYAMAEHGELPRVFAATHPRFRTPHVAILFTAAAGLGLVLSGTFTYLIGLSVIARLSTYLATVAALPMLRRQAGRFPARFTVRGGAGVVAATLAACVWLITQSGWRELRDFAIAVGIGLALYGLRRFAQTRSGRPARA